jgi:spore coat protein A
MAATGLAMGQTKPKRAGTIERPPLNLDALAKFVDPLPIPPLAQPRGKRPDPSRPNVAIPFYRMSMRQITQKLHRDVPATRCWGFGATSPGPTFETRSGEGFLVEWANELPTEHFLPVDHTVHGAERDKPAVRVVTHLHGAKAPAKSDGYPEDWCVPGKSAIYHYPNEQEAAHLWYHDHALGITRLNVYAGLFGSSWFAIRSKTGWGCRRGGMKFR